MVAHPPKRQFSREEVRRAFDISERRLRAWERQNLIPAADTFGLSEIVALRALDELRKHGVSYKRVREALDALRRTLHGVSNPLTEVKIFADGKRIGVHVAGRKMEPITGQLLLDFDKQEMSRLLSFPNKAVAEKQDARIKRERRQEAERWFQKGLDLEQAGASFDLIVEAYRNAIENDPYSAGALVNLGTVYFNARMWQDAETYYRKALEVDREYPLAHFNLGNLFDEKGDRELALHHYLEAIRVNPQYADAHYNLALLHQMSGEALKAVRHWRIYLKLDSSSSWAVIARRELEKLRAVTIVRGSGTRGTSAGSSSH